MLGLIRRQGSRAHVSACRSLAQASYSTKPSSGADESKQANAPFLNDILAKIARIDKSIAAKKAELQQSPAKGQNNKKRSGNTNPGSKQQSKAPQNRQQEASKPKHQQTPNAKQPTTSTTPKPANIKVADHPLFTNKFRARDQSEKASQGEEGYKARGPRRPRGQQASQRSNQSQPSGDSRGPRQQRPRRQRDNAKASKNASSETRVATKQLKSSAFIPGINGATFFYGKVPSVNINALTRIASVNKLALVKLNYPYLLPRSVINSLPKRAPRFIASQSSFTTDVDGAFVAEKVRSVVKGEAELLPKNIGGKVWDKASAETSVLELNKNASLSYDDKVRMYEITAGIQNTKDLFPTAIWNK